MANAEAGSAYISIIPSMKGFDSQLGDGIKGAVSKVSKAAAAGLAAIGAGAVAAGKMALDSFSDYQQLSGGIEKIFGDAAEQVKGYADQAYYTAGLSANDYMRQVSSFSASLKQSFGGDVVAAAERANEAMVDMSDNANVFGSNIEDIQNAYQGFAKQNYTMLDNLKLGYGGTQAEMKRLISDANAWEKANGKAGDLTIEKFGDVVQAIHDVQEAQGIAGDTAWEAEKTIAGSLAMAKASWENWLTGLGNDQADMGALTDQLIKSVETAANNIGPRVAIIGQRIVAALPQVAKMVGDAAYSLLREAIVNAWSMAADALSGAGIQLPALDASGFDSAIQSIVSGIQQALPVIAGFAGAFTALETAKKAIDGINEGIKLVNAGIALMSNPLMAAVVAIGAAAGAMAVLYATNDSFRAGVDALISDLSGTFGPVLEGLQLGLQAVGDYLSATFGPAVQVLADGLAAFAGTLGSTFQPVLDAAGNAFRQIGDALTASVGPAFMVLQPILEAVAAALAGAIGPALTAVADIVSTVLVTAFTVAGSLITAAMQVISGAVQAAVGIIEGIVGVFVGVFTGDWQMAADGAQNIMSGLAGIVSGRLNALSGTIGGILGGIVGLFTSILNGITGIVSGIFGGIARTIGDRIDGAKNVVRDGLDAISGFFSGLHLSLPHISLPHFSISGSFSLDPPSVPSIGIDWYARGGIATHMAVLGEAGAEAIVPYENANIRPWAASLAREASRYMDVPAGDGSGEILQLLQALLAKDTNVYLDRDTLVGGTAEAMDRALGARKLAGAR